MGLTAKDKGGGDYEPIPEDLHIAICYGIWDLGMQHSDRFDKSIHKIIINWELPEVRGEFDRDGKKINLPRAISKRYTLSLHKKADLRKDLESWRGKKFTEDELNKGFDLKKLLGVPCQIQVLHNKVEDKIYANVSAIIKAPTGTKLLPENPITFFSFEENVDIPQSTPEWIMKLIKEAKEYGGGIPNEHEKEQYSDEIPF